MKAWKLKLGNSVFSRLIIAFLIIMAPIYILGVYIYQWGVGTLKDEISQSTIAQATFYLEGLENEIERIKILQYDCLNDENLNRLTIRWKIMDQYDINESIRQLHQRLITIHNSSEYIKNVSVHIYPIQRTISSNASIADFNNEKYEGIRVPTGNKGAQIISFDGGLYLSTIQEESVLYGNPFYLIEIELDTEALRSALSQFDKQQDSGSYLVSLYDNDIIINQTDSQIMLKEDTIDVFRDIEPYGILSYKIGEDDYYIVQAESKYLQMALIRYFPKVYIQKPLNNFYIWVWIFTISAIFIILFYSFYVYRLMYKPMLTLVSSFKIMESGNLEVSIDHNTKDEFGYLFNHFNDMTSKLRALIDQVYNQKIMRQRAELKQMQSQINPHFLYNSFFMLNTMVRVNDENLMNFTKYLGEYFRYITRNSSDYVPLIEEINHAKVYAKIQLIRFPRRFKMKFEKCPEECKKYNVPRLILQPIIENAFEHGIGKKSIDGIISFKYEISDSEFAIIVEDNGDELSDMELENLQKALEYTGNDIEITGIINIARRIRLVFGEESGLNVSRSILGGLKVEIRVKKGGEGHLQIANS